MHIKDESLEVLPLADHAHLRPSYVLTEITGDEANVKHAVIQWRWECTELHFCRLHLDDARLDVDWTEPMEDPENVVYNLEEKTWTTKGMSGYSFQSYGSFEAFRSTENVYFLTREEQDYPPYDKDPSMAYAHRCNLKEAKWEILRVDATDMLEIAPLVNAESGEDEGFLAVSYETVEGQYRVDRYLFNTVDSLERLAMDAFRKHNMNAKGDFNFHFFLNETTPGKKILPSMYSGMKPLDPLP
ncbi:hypothetical protein M3Y99_01243000 [Aphelenchoides fujianensis]|nr:hypothetical protein M3Y99_01243000 [Aphelenchoides fujianensis]